MTPNLSNQRKQSAKIITFDLLCHANFSPTDDSDFHCGECCFTSTLYP